MDREYDEFIEPVARTVQPGGPDRAVLVSIAVSLKRIADGYASDRRERKESGLGKVGDGLGQAIAYAMGKDHLIRLTVYDEMLAALRSEERAVEEHSKCDCARHPNDFLTGMCQVCTTRYMTASDMRRTALARAEGRE